VETNPDVLVVGAGPAGNRVAGRLARLGLRVVVADPRPRLGDKPCTGIVSRECFEAYGGDPALIHRTATSARFIGPSGQVLRVARSDVQALIVDRVAFVEGLAETARREGARYIRARVLRVRVDREGVEADLLNGMPGATLRARALVLAGGFRSPLLAQVGLRPPGQWILGLQAEAWAPGVEEVEVYLAQRWAPGFFAWVVPTRPGRALVGLFARHRPAEHFHAFVEALTQVGKMRGLVGPPRGWGLPLRPPLRTVADRVVVVGDSAGQVKPTTGGGIYYALLCADLAGEALAQAFREEDLSARALAPYDRQWRALLGRELQLGYLARRLYEALPDPVLDDLFSWALREGLDRTLARLAGPSFDWHGRFIAWGLRHPYLVRRVMGAFPRALLSLPRRDR